MRQFLHQRLALADWPAPLHPYHRWLPTPQETVMSDLNDAGIEPPPEVKAKLKKAEEESRKLDSPQRTNDSTIDPERPVEDILKGYHGG
jgi:hypothetical protein